MKTKSVLITVLFVLVILAYIYFSLPKTKLIWLGKHRGKLIGLGTGGTDKETGQKWVNVQYVNKDGQEESRNFYVKDFELKRF